MNAMPAFSSRFGSCGSSVRTSIARWLSRASISRWGVAPPSASASVRRTRTAASCTICVSWAGTDASPVSTPVTCSAASTSPASSTAASAEGSSS